MDLSKYHTDSGLCNSPDGSYTAAKGGGQEVKLGSFCVFKPFYPGQMVPVWSVTYGWVWGISQVYMDPGPSSEVRDWSSLVLVSTFPGVSGFRHEFLDV